MDKSLKKKPEFPAPNPNPSVSEGSSGGGRAVQSPDVRLTTDDGPKDLYVCTWNARTLASDDDLDAMLHDLDYVKCDILAVQETKRLKKKLVRWETGHEVLLGEKEGLKGGVGFVVSPRVTANVVNMVVLSHRLAVLCLRFGKMRVVVFNLYAPHSQADPADIEMFYDDVRAAYDTYRGNLMLTVGDFNARIGMRKDGEFRIGPYGYGERNEQGDTLVDLIEERRLYHCNSFYPKRECRKWTWRHPNGNSFSEIDHILTNRKDLVKDTGVVPPFGGSDHRMLRCRLQIPVRPYAFSTPAATLLQRDAAHAYIEHHVGLNPTYEELTSTMAAAVTVASVPAVGHNERRITTRTQDLLRTRSRIAPDPSRHLEYCLISRQARQMYALDLRAYRERKLHEAASNRRSLKTTKRAMAKQRAMMEALETPAGIVTSRPEIEKTTTEFYTDLYKDELQLPRRDYTPGNVPDVLPSEVRAALSQTKTGKAPGPDGISADILKAGGVGFHRAVAALFTNYLNGEKIPDDWRTAKLVLLHKKGPREQLGN